MHWYSSNEVYIGQWMSGLQHGNGKHVWILNSTDDSQVNCFTSNWIMRNSHYTDYKRAQWFFASKM